MRDIQGKTLLTIKGHKNINTKKIFNQINNSKAKKPPARKDSRKSHNPQKSHGNPTQIETVK